MQQESKFPEFPDLPPEFLKWVETTGRQIKEIPKDIVEAFNEWQREKGERRAGCQRYPGQDGLGLNLSLGSRPRKGEGKS